MQQARISHPPRISFMRRSLSYLQTSSIVTRVVTDCHIYAHELKRWICAELAECALQALLCTTVHAPPMSPVGGGGGGGGSGSKTGMNMLLPEGPERKMRIGVTAEQNGRKRKRGSNDFLTWPPLPPLRISARLRT
jgi:hypothetical protein